MVLRASISARARATGGTPVAALPVDGYVDGVESPAPLCARSGSDLPSHEFSYEEEAMDLRLPAYLVLLLSVGSASGQLDQLSGLNGLQDIELAELSQQDDNPLGKTALTLHPEDWKHAEGEHFIYHYTRNFVASRAAVEAEFNFRVVARELEKEEPASDRKSHLYIFDRPEDWAEFQKAGELERWTGGIHSAGSLFLLRDPRYRFSGHTLGHEIAHLMIYRCYGPAIPCWLNEGFAEYVSRNSRASFQRARGYLAKPHSHLFSAGEFIPIEQLMTMTRPPNQRVETYYNESERLVRFLVVTDKSHFVNLLDALGRKEAFDDAFARVYAGTFASRTNFEEKFREYASNDFGTALQDQP